MTQQQDQQIRGIYERNRRAVASVTARAVIVLMVVHFVTGLDMQD